MNKSSNHLKNIARSCSLLGDRLTIIEESINKTSHLNGEIWECGAFKGGTGLYMKAHLIEKELKKMVRLFDTFCGMPNATEYDVHQVGSFSDANLATAKSITVGLEDINIHVGVMPETFTGLESCQIDVAHVDVDNYLSVKACLEFIWPRMPVGGYIIIDDYNDASCFGAKKATNDFFESQHDLFNNKQQIITSEYKANPQAYIIKQ